MLQRVGETPLAPDTVRDADIFISYQRDNKAAAERLAEALDAPNRRVWLDGRLRPDARWRADIEEKLKRARCVVAIWSKKAATSGWVNYESFRAQQEGKLIAVTFDKINENELPAWLADQQITDLRGWTAKNHLHNGWMKIKRLVSAKCSQLPDYKFKGWLGGGAAHENVTSLSFHPTEDAVLVSTGSEGDASLWLASQAKPGWRGGYDEDGNLIKTDPNDYGQSNRFSAPQPESGSQRASLWRAQFSPDGERVLLAGRSGDAYVLSRGLREVLLKLDHNVRCGVSFMSFAKSGRGAHRDGVADACETPDGDFVTVGGYQAVVWSADGQPRHQRPVVMPDGAHARLVRALYCDAVEGVILGDRLGKVRVLDPKIQNGIGYQIDDRANTTVHLALGPAFVDGSVKKGVLAVVSASPEDSEIRIHDWLEGAFGRPRPNPIFDDAPPIHAIAMHPTAPVLAIGSNAVRPRLWDYTVREPMEMDQGGWHERAITALAFSATGKYLAVGSEEGRISIWENIAQNF